MPTPVEKALAYLDGLEAERRAALALSEQKTEEAKLIKARQEGFRAALEMLGREATTGNAGSEFKSGRAGQLCQGATVSNTGSEFKEARRRRARRQIPQLILRELAFSGEAMTARQVAKAIDYIPERTEMALRRMEESGQVHRNGRDRWAIGVTAMAELNEAAVTADNGKSTTTVPEFNETPPLHAASLTAPQRSRRPTVS